MSRYINEDEILKRQKDVILFNGAKHRCFDTTELAEVPTANVIPIEWIKEQKDKCYPYSITEITLEHLLAEWEGEKNEQNS